MARAAAVLVLVCVVVALVGSAVGDSSLTGGAPLSIAEVSATAAAHVSPSDNLLKALFELRLDLDGNGRVTQAELDAFYVASGTSHHAPAEVLAVLNSVQGGAAAATANDASSGSSTMYADAGFTWDEFRAMFKRLDTTKHPAKPREVRVEVDAVLPHLHAACARVAGLTSLAQRARTRQVHLALTGVNSEMRVMWVTTDDYAPPTSSIVQWGVAPGDYSSGSANGTSYTYTVPKRWWGGFNGFIHEAIITGLVSTPALALVRVCVARQRSGAG